MFEHESLVGIAIQTILFLLGGYGMVLRNDWSNRALKAEMTGMKEELKKLADVITIQAVQTNRIDNLATQVSSIEKRVEDLRRGNGLVLRKSIDEDHH